MTLNYQMTVERYLNPNRGVGGSILGCEIFSLLDEKNQEPTHRKVGSKPHPAPRESLNRVGPTGSNSLWIVRHCILLHLPEMDLSMCMGSSWAYIVSQDPNDSKPNRLHVDTFQFYLIHLRYIP